MKTKVDVMDAAFGDWRSGVERLTEFPEAMEALSAETYPKGVKEFIEFAQAVVPDAFTKKGMRRVAVSLKKLIAQNPDDKELLQQIANKDPSGKQYAYTGYMYKLIKEGANKEAVIRLVNEFVDSKNVLKDEVHEGEGALLKHHGLQDTRRPRCCCARHAPQRGRVRDCSRG